jgi:hypothetical protein
MSGRGTARKRKTVSYAESNSERPTKTARRQTGSKAISNAQKRQSNSTWSEAIKENLRKHITPEAIRKAHQEDLDCASVFTFGQRCKLDNLLESTIKNAVHKYFSLGPRSSDKLVELHDFLALCVEVLLGDPKLSVRSYGIGGEAKIPGYVNEKNMDIAVCRECAGGKEEFVAGIEVKFVMSNYGKNANNYIEGAMGQSVNLKLRNPEFVFWHFFASFSKVPQFKFDKRSSDYDVTFENVKGFPVLRREYGRFHKIKRDNMGVIADKPTRTLLPDNASITVVDMTPAMEAIWKRPPATITESNLMLATQVRDHCRLVVRNEGNVNNVSDWICNLIDFVRSIKRAVSNPRSRDALFVFPRP